jgi:HEAT repeat protein
MNRWWLALAVTIALAPLFPGAEPDINIEGKPLSEWLQGLKQGKETVKAFELVRLLARTTPGAVNEVVETLLMLDDPRQAAQGIASLGAPAVPALIRVLLRAESRQQLIALYTLGVLSREARSARVIVRGLLDQNDPLVREMAVRVLGSIDPDAGVRLRPLLKDREANVQFAAARAMVESGAPAGEVLPTLQEWLRGKPEQRRVALNLLTKLGPEAKPTVAGVLASLQAEDVEGQILTLEVLGQIGPGAAEAVPALKALLADPKHSNLAHPVAQALWQIARAPEASNTWKALAQDPKSEQRVRAARCWWFTTRDPAAIKILVESVQVEKARQADAALEALREVGPSAALVALEPLQKLLADPKCPLADSIVITLGSFGEAARPAAEAVANRTQERQTPDAASRYFARLALAQIRQDAESLRLLAEVLSDKDATLRTGAARALGAFPAHAETIRPTLRKVLDDPDGSVRAAAAVSLHLLKRDPQALDVLAACLKDAQAEVRSTAALELGYNLAAEARTAVPALIERLWDDDVTVRSAAAESLGRIGPEAKAAVPALQAMLADDQGEDLHSVAAEALSLIGPVARAAVPTLKQRLDSLDPYVRACAALALWHIEKDNSTEKMLVPLLEHRNYRVRVMAAEAIWRQHEHPRAVPALLEVLRGTDFSGPWAGGNQAFMAIRALGRIGPKAAPALPDIRDRLTSEDAELRRTARTAIQAIERK